MYSFVSGIVEEKDNNIVVVNCNGVGYELNVSNYTLEKMCNVGEYAKIYTYLYVREDAMLLFGFATFQEKELFLQLITVSGVGAKTAIGILSGLNPNDLISAILIGDVNTIGKVKGIGKKTAERIVLELKNSLVNIKNKYVIDVPNSEIVSNSATDEVIELLISMGITKYDAIKIVNSVATANDTTEEIVAKSLKNMK